jgi:uncharacterized protein
VPPVKAVLDTNVIVSALLKGEGQEALIFDLAKSRRFTLVVSQALLAEYEAVLRRPEFGFAPRKVKKAMRDIQSQALHANPQTHVHAARDPDDNMVLECALAGGAQYVVTGNTRHFPREFQGIRVIPPRQFLVILAAELE